MKKWIVFSLLVVFGCWSPGFAAVNPAYEGGGAVTKWAKKGPPFVEGQVLLKMKPGFSPAAAAHAAAGRVRRPIGDGSIFLLEVGKGNVGAAVQTLKGRGGVAIAEPNWIRRLHAEGPNDVGYGYKWDLNNAGPVLPLKCVTNIWGEMRCPTVGADIDWQVAYDDLTARGILPGSSPVTIAVIDSGVDLSHPDLDSKLVSGWDFVGNCDVTGPLFDPATCGDSDPTDLNGHGTHTAGIALSEANNGVWSAGTGYDSSIKAMALRVCDEVGQCPDSALIAAINHAVASGANVINLSLGGSEEDTPGALEPVIDAAWNAGLVVVASAGNGAVSENLVECVSPVSPGIAYPARFGNVVAVGSTNWGDELACYSDFGPKPGQHHVTAPGGEIEIALGMFPDDNPFAGVYSILPTYPTYISSILGVMWAHDEDLSVPYSYIHEGWLDGTSMAAPQASGLAALLFAVGVADTNGNGRVNDEIRDIIETTADDLGDSGYDEKYGHGRINVDRAVTAALPSGTGNYPPVAVNDNWAVNEDTSLSETEPGVLGNDNDVDGSMTAVLDDPPSHAASFNLNSDGSFSYTPNPNFNGNDSFTYYANDGTENSAQPATVTITVNPVNDPPVAVDTPYTTDEEIPLDQKDTDVLGNDNDVDGDSMTAVMDNPPSHAASFSFNPDGSFSYTPNPDFNGTDSFTYYTNDGTVNSAQPATVTITVNPVNDAPVAVGNAFTTEGETPLDVEAPGVLGNDTDVDGDHLSALLVSSPDYGLLVWPGDGSFIYTHTPDPDASGTDSFTYYAYDGTENSAQATVTITINETNDPFVLDPPAALEASVAGTVVTLNWGDNSIGEESFEIERAIKLKGKYIFAMIDIVDANTHVYKDDVGEPGTYKYRVRAIADSGGLVSGYSNEVQVKVESTVIDGGSDGLAAPTNLTATVEGSSVTLIWEDNSSDETGFTVERGLRVKGKVSYGEPVYLGANVIIYTDSPEPGTYVYRVKAINTTTSTTSAYSNDISVRIK